MRSIPQLGSDVVWDSIKNTPDFRILAQKGDYGGRRGLSKIILIINILAILTRRDCLSKWGFGADNDPGLWFIVCASR